MVPCWFLLTVNFVHGTANSITFVFNSLLPRGDGDGDDMSRNNFDLVVVGVNCQTHQKIS